MASTDFTPRADTAMMVAGVARIATGLSFMIFGLTKLINIPGTTGFISRFLPMPSLVFWLAVLIEAGLGLCLVLGLRVRPIAAFLALYVVFIGLVFHFEPTVMQQRDQFLKNICMAAGLLYIYAFGPGAWSVERRSGL